ncbi:imidazolonepropionase [Thiomonas sp. FB-6]|uniref:imidazolonepropionase n=1 Tax=Thiomonas sp. FB-6 TaxID=1158291 RepID=UPI00038070B0|nr:imidazolonepropionase [Thiomonas sp. FB-6]
MSTRTLYRDALLCTLAGDAGWGLVDNAAMVAEGGTLRWVGAASELPAHLEIDEEYHLGGTLVTPGLVDCHTHLVYGGHRADEFELRLGGAGYADIAAAGGGILSTVRATRMASDERLFADARERAMAMLRGGVTTLEIKSGYGLDFAHEVRCLRVARRIGEVLPLTVRTTCLAAHALPPEYAGQADAYIDHVCSWLPRLAEQDLADAIDAFCEAIAFDTAQIERVFKAARGAGLPVKLHAEQLSCLGGAELAAAYGALSCDHLEYLDAAGVAAMAAGGSVAVLLPGAFYFLRETQLPPVRALREAGVPIALASDHNPGSSPMLSPTLVLNMGCTLFRLRPEEALRGMTVNAAQALGLHDRGRLAPGQRADFVAWPLNHPNELCYWIGQPGACRPFIAGAPWS